MKCEELKIVLYTNKCPYVCLLLTLVLLNQDIPPCFANSVDPDQLDLHCLSLSM